MHMTESRRFIRSNPALERGVRIRSLAISPFPNDLSFLQRKFQELKWTLYTADTYRGALTQLNRPRVSIVICESQLPDGNWKDVLSQIAPLPDRPRLIVVSRNADESLWAEYWRWER